MKLRTLLAAAALSACAGSALADGVGQATLQSPISKPVSVIAGDAFWNCAGASCVSGGATDQSLTISACKTIVKTVGGPVSAYSIGGSALPANLLAKCNAAAPSPTVASAH